MPRRRMEGPLEDTADAVHRPMVLIDDGSTGIIVAGRTR